MCSYLNNAVFIGLLLESSIFLIQIAESLGYDVLIDRVIIGSLPGIYHVTRDMSRVNHAIKRRERRGSYRSYISKKTKELTRI